MKYHIATLAVVLFLSGCATTNTGDMSGSYYRVRATDTLYGISKAYKVPVEVIADKNGITNLRKLKAGQLIFIPKNVPEPKKASALHSTRPTYSKGEKFSWPVKGAISTKFGTTKNASKTNGIEIRTRAGSTIVAARSGKVTFSSDYLKGYGKTIIIDHGDGYQSVYAYNDENLVSQGDYVKQGQAIAKVGNSGRANEPTLHFEIRKKNFPVDPLEYLY